MALKQSIPDVGGDLDSHTRALKAIKEAVELGQGNSREVMKSYLTLQAAADLGLVGATGLAPRIQRFFIAGLNSPWKNYDLSDNFNKFGFYRDGLSRVFLRGLVSTGTEATTIATLPAGFRPERRCIFSCLGSISSVENGRRVDVQATGEISYIGTGTLDYLSLDGISFAAYQ